MRSLLIQSLLTALIVAYPYSIEENQKMVITVDYYPKDLIIYEGKHDIVDIMVPLNNINGYDSSEIQDKELSHLKKSLMIFFIEADIEDGRRVDHGIYMYKNNKAIKIMDKGTAITASADESEYVFLGAKDGLYIYNPVSQKIDKYGNYNISVKDMAKEQNTDVIYILTDDRELYRIYDDGTKKVKVDDVKNAEQIVLDYSNNLYYHDKDNKLYVRTVKGEIKKIKGLPEGADKIKLLRPLLFNDEEIGLMIDNDIYSIYPDGTSEPENLEFTPEAKPTAYSMETGILHYFGYKKKIYEYDLITLSWG